MQVSFQQLLTSIFLGIFLFSPSICRADSETDTKIIQLQDDELTATVSQPDEPFERGDRVCAYQRTDRVSCGTVKKVDDEKAIVVFDDTSERPLVGDTIKLESRRDLASQPEEDTLTDDEASSLSDENLERNKAPVIATSEDEEKRRSLIRYHRRLIKKRYISSEELSNQPLTHYYNATIGGLLFGESTTNSIWPTLSFQFAMSRNSAVSLSAGYYTFGGNSVTGSAWYGLINYHYFSDETFTGPTGRVGLGCAGATYNAVSGSHLTSGKTTPFLFTGTMGWRWKVDRTINIGLEGGFLIQQISVNTYFSSTATTSAVTYFIPLLTLDIGFAF